MMTKTQRKVLTFIHAELDRTGGVAPTYREISEFMGHKSVNAAFHIVERLIERGYIRRVHGRHRALDAVRNVQWLRWDDETKSLTPLGDPFERQAS